MRKKKIEKEKEKKGIESWIMERMMKNVLFVPFFLFTLISV